VADIATLLNSPEVTADRHELMVPRRIMRHVHQTRHVSSRSTTVMPLLVFCLRSLVRILWMWKI